MKKKDEKTTKKKDEAIFQGLIAAVRDYTAAHTVTMPVYWAALHQLVSEQVQRLAGQELANKYAEMVRNFADSMPDPVKDRVLFYKGHTILLVPDPDTTRWGFILKKGRVSLQKASDVTDILQTSMGYDLPSREAAIANASALVDKGDCLCCNGGLMKANAPQN